MPSLPPIELDCGEEMIRQVRDAVRSDNTKSISGQLAAYSIVGIGCWSLASVGIAIDDEGPSYSYYVVTAVPDRALRSILNAASPIHHDGKVFFGNTDWHVQWNMWWSEQPRGSCKITRVEAKISGTILLPKIVNATEAQRNRFDTLAAALRVHELGHYDIGKKAAADIESGILAMPPMDTCAALKAAADELATETLDEYRAVERKYDADTDHGRTQGAWLD